MTFISKTARAIGTILTGTSSPQVQGFRRATCYTCPTAVNNPGKGISCGEYLNPVSGVSCGCLIDDAVVVEGKKCPQGKW